MPEKLICGFKWQNRKDREGWGPVDNMLDVRSIKYIEECEIRVLRLPIVRTFKTASSYKFCNGQFFLSAPSVLRWQSVGFGDSSVHFAYAHGKLSFVVENFLKILPIADKNIITFNSTTLLLPYLTF